MHPSTSRQSPHGADGGAERWRQHKYDSRSARAPAGVAQRRDPARGSTTRPQAFSWRGASPRSSAGCKSGSPAGSLSRPLLPTRKLTLKRTDALQHDLSTLSADTWGSTAGRWCSGDSSWEPSPPPKLSASRKLARPDRPQNMDLTPGAGPACRLMPCRGAEVDMHSIVPPVPVHYHLH